MKKLILPILVLCAASSGCARFTTTQTDLSYDPKGAPQRTITTKASATTFAASKTALAKWKASQTDRTQGASVGQLDQAADATPLIDQLIRGVFELGKKSAIPIP